MDMDIDSMSPEYLQALQLYYVSQEPPYLLLTVGLFSSIVCGLAFQAVLKQGMQAWMQTRSTDIATLRNQQLLVPFLGMAIGAIVFLAAGVEIFGFPAQIGYAIAVPMTLLVGGLVWRQLGNILKQIESGGSAALDLDSF